ncbi:5-guanidino-2-oxopentanoate decarboxylase [Paracoccus mangrovi]|uniref:5-guanidino-2-oxopentanoate decarboxylase n=1 Tax=Paracoccus mangrovi TaxID=1715645 RepID=A0ABV7RC85_9RHOB
MTDTTVGLELVRHLEALGVDVVFGIPGVHTTELYRGLATSTIRHVTPRHELDAGFMADGYARASGKPGVCLLITGPGITNAITAMAQARADSIPMLVISGINALATHGHYRGHLHELPDQSATLKTIAKHSERLIRADDIADALARAMAAMNSGRPGPVHIEIPTDLMEAPLSQPRDLPPSVAAPMPDARLIDQAAGLCAKAVAPVILAGGGAVWADDALRALAMRLDAPVVTTTNARGLLAGHALAVPASPSLPPVRALIEASDLVIAVGTQFGPTDYDAYLDGGFKAPPNTIRIDRDPEAAKTSFPATVTLCGDSAAVLDRLNAALAAPPAPSSTGAARAAETRQAAMAALSPKMQVMTEVLAVIRDTLPGCTIVGDSTQLVYGGNLYWEAAAPRSWFNASTGYGALGYGPPAAIGASLALPDAPVVCLVGDGGFQFCLGALGSATDEASRVIFLVWNNNGYQEIEDHMVSRGITPVGVRPSAPDFRKIAEGYGIPSERIRLTDGNSQAALAPGKLDLAPLAAALIRARAAQGPALIEVMTP